MLSGLDRDIKLIPPAAGGWAEGGYAAWNLLWSHDFGGAAGLHLMWVDNLGNSIVGDTAPGWRVHHLTAADVLTTYLNEWLHDFTPVGWGKRSTTGRYVVTNDQAVLTNFHVHDYGVLTFSRNLILDNADAADIRDYGISPNGRYVGLIVQSIATANWRYYMLYQGA